MIFLSMYQFNYLDNVIISIINHFEIVLTQFNDILRAIITDNVLISLNLIAYVLI